MRLFVCVDIPEEVKLKLASIQDKLKDFVDGSFVPIDNMHMTIKFLGEVNEDCMDKVKSVCSDLSLLKKFDLELSNLGAFPSEKTPRVLWTGTNKGDVELKLMREVLDRKLDPLGFKDNYDFNAHLTLVRLKSIKNREALLKFIENNKISFGKFQVEKVILKESVLSHSGAKHSVIDAVLLR